MSLGFPALIANMQGLKIISSVFDSKRNASNITPDFITKLNLLEKIVINECRKSCLRLEQSSNLYAIIENLPKYYSVDTRLNMLIRMLSNHIAMPVMTSHPTRVITNLAIQRLYDITEATIMLEQDNLSKKETGNLKSTIKMRVLSLIEEPVIQIKNLTPKEEAEYTLYIYKKILKSFPDFFNKLVDKFQKTHGGSHIEIASKLKPSIMLSFRNIYSWTRGDADGNYNVTRETMEQTVPAQQIAIIEVYRDKLNKIRTEAKISHINSSFIETISKIDAYLGRCVNSINAGVWFDVAGSHEAVLNITERLVELQQDIPLKLQEMLTDLRHLIDLAEFFGGMKEYVRQTTFLNSEVLDDLMDILVNHNIDIRNLAKNKNGDLRKYSELNRNEKILLHKKISSNPAYFVSLKQNIDKFSKSTVRELERLFFVLQHADIFPFYICSDTEDKINFNEVQILLRFSSYLDGYLRIRQMNNYPINFLFLCENPKDLSNILNIMSDILSDDPLRRRVVESGYISYVSGPSDLGKTGGIATHISLYLAQMNAQKLLDDFKNKYPELKNVQLRVLHGYGGDMKRRIGEAALQMHSTFQGRDAYDGLGAPGAFASYVHRVAGSPSASECLVFEIEEIRRKNPRAFQQLLVIEKKAVQGFQKFINGSESGELLIALTDSEIEKRLNTSSRAGSKLSTKDITKVRAIGITNLYIYSRVNFDIFMSVVGWLSLLDKNSREFSYLFKNSKVIKDIIYKVMFSIAVSDIPRAWGKINNGIIPSREEVKNIFREYKNGEDNHRSLQEVLAYIDISSYLILEKIILFFPQNKKNKINSYFKDRKFVDKSSNDVALEMMDLLGDDFSVLASQTRDLLVDFKQLTDCIDTYEENNNKKNLENVILCLRGGRLTGGPDCIAKFFGDKF
ncbi:MAG: phosphoenolpyruvate carboxylase [Legionellaceae bacterium]|nr:phosphoenolpyruvate carboxylase [Legionellaceae bacterium]